jgi:hypothetical protein
MTAQQIAAYVDHMLGFTEGCHVCDEPVLDDAHQGLCSTDCLTTACEEQHEAWCERYYGGEG